MLRHAHTCTCMFDMQYLLIWCIWHALIIIILPKSFVYNVIIRRYRCKSLQRKRYREREKQLPRLKSKVVHEVTNEAEAARSPAVTVRWLPLKARAVLKWKTALKFQCDFQAERRRLKPTPVKLQSENLIRSNPKICLSCWRRSWARYCCCLAASWPLRFRLVGIIFTEIISWHGQLAN